MMMKILNKELVISRPSDCAKTYFEQVRIRRGYLREKSNTGFSELEI